MNTRIDQLQNLIDQNHRELKKISQNEFEIKPQPNKWSKKEILGHLVDSAQNNIQRFIRGQYQDTPSLIYNQDEWVRLNNHQGSDLEELIELWRLLNRQILRIWKNMPEENLKRPCDVNGELVNIEWHVNDYTDHLIHHMKQIVGH